MEEDIKILEEMLSSKEPVCNYKLKHQEIEAISNLLTRYKQLEEENKSKQKAYDDCYCEYKHYKQFDSIPKSKVKDKIEEYDKQRIKMEKDDIGVGFTLGKEWSDLKDKIEVLQQLLKD